MIYDVRIYTCRPGTVNQQLALYAAEGYPAQERHLGVPILYAIGEVGNPNQYIHVWAYDSQADRETRRAAMMADQDWLDYLKRSAEAGYLISQENAIYTQVPFTPAPR